VRGEQRLALAQPLVRRLLVEPLSHAHATSEGAGHARAGAARLQRHRAAQRPAPQRRAVDALGVEDGVHVVDEGGGAIAVGSGGAITLTVPALIDGEHEEARAQLLDVAGAVPGAPVVHQAAMQQHERPPFAGALVGDAHTIARSGIEGFSSGHGGDHHPRA
jgi:hypothetical protein